MGNLFSYFFNTKTPDNDFSTVHEIKGYSYDLSNSDDVKKLLARLSCEKKKIYINLIKGLIYRICDKKTSKSVRDDYVRQIERITLSDEDYEDYKRTLDKRKQEKAKYCANKEFYFNDFSKRNTKYKKNTKKKKICGKKKSSS